jgi:transcription elongation factor GreA
VTPPSDATESTWLPQEAFDRLQAEYDDRSGPLRTEITKRIEAAREEGDLKENGGYHAAKEEQGKNEARIRQLRQLLENAQVGDAPESDGTAKAGMVVTVRFAGDDDTERFLLGNREANADSDLEVYSPTSPLGSALLGAKIGSTVEYAMPNGRKASVELVDAVPFSG